MAALLDGWALDVSSLDERAAVHSREEQVAIQKQAVQRLTEAVSTSWAMCKSPRLDGTPADTMKYHSVTVASCLQPHIGTMDFDDSYGRRLTSNIMQQHCAESACSGLILLRPWCTQKVRKEDAAASLNQHIMLLCLSKARHIIHT